MILMCNGRAYRTAEMQAFRTGDPDAPYIYLTSDGRSTFVLRHDPDGTLSAHRAGTGEIIALARRYELEGLLGAFPAAFAPVEILPTGEADEDLVSHALLAGDIGTPRAGVGE